MASMTFRLLAAAFAAALLATLGLMFARVASTPVGQLDTHGSDILLIHHLVLGLAGGLALQVFLLYRPLTGLYRALAWGAAGFLALNLMPWLVLPDTVPGQVTGRHPLRWLVVVTSTAGGLWLLWSPGIVGKSRKIYRSAGCVLVLLPLLGGTLGGADQVLPENAVSGDIGADPEAELAVWRGLGLNLLFWLLLGLSSVLTARRIVQRPQRESQDENLPGNGSGGGPGML